MTATSPLNPGVRLEEGADGDQGSRQEARRRRGGQADPAAVLDPRGGFSGHRRGALRNAPFTENRPAAEVAGAALRHRDLVRDAEAGNARKRPSAFASTPAG